MPADTPFTRMEALFGPDSMARLAQSRVVVLGIGGVGGHCAEALARCGIGSFVLIDGDRVSLTNLNRQAVAFHSTLDRWKVDVMHERILDINPTAQVEVISAFYAPEDTLGLWQRPLDLVIDAIDRVTAKVDLAVQAQRLGIPALSCMGAGNKLDPGRFEATDLYQTSVCPLCRAVRKLAREKGVERLRVVYSKEEPAKSTLTVPASVVYVTATAGLRLAAEAVNMLLVGAPYSAASTSSIC